MPPFQYSQYRNPYVQSISALLEQPGQIEAARAQQVGQAQAQAAQQRGAAWSGAAQNIGQDVSGAIQQYQKMKMEAPLKAAQLADVQSQIAERTATAAQRTDQAQSAAAFDQALKGAMVTNPDTGLVTYDRNKAMALLTSAGKGHLAPQINEILDKSDAADIAIQKAHQDAIKSSASLVDALGNDPTVFANELQRGIANKRYTQAEAQPFLDAIQSDPKKVAAITGHLLGKDAAKLEEHDPTKELRNPQTGALVVAATPADPKAVAPTEAGLFDAHQKLEAKRLLGQSLTPDEQASYDAYNKMKNDPAAARAAAATEATNARLDKSENFQEQERGRAILDKAEQTYNEARQKSAVLKTFVDLAKGGNVVAGSGQALVATMATLGAEGFKRLTGTELATTTAAGSAWDRLKGSIGKIVEGQPLDAQVQKDMITLADALAKGSYGQYKDTFDSATGRYKLANEKPLPEPSVVAPKIVRYDASGKVIP